MDQKISFFELQKKVNQFANALASLGIEKYDRVMIRMPNRPEFVIGCLACWRLGAIPVLTHHLIQSDEIVFRANDTEAKAILVSSDTFPAVKEGLDRCPSLRSVMIAKDRIDNYLFLDDLIQNQSDQCVTTETTKNDWLRIIYSSGTTGKPKGIISAIGDMVAGINVANRYLLHLTENDVLGSPPAFTFAFGFFSILFFGISGCTLNIIEDFSAENMFKAIENNRISVLRCVPTGLRMMLNMKDSEKKYDLRSLRLCQSSGEVLPSVVAKEWKSRFGVTVLNSLGSAELNSYMSTHVDMPDEKLDSLGMPVPGVDYRLVDSEFKEVPAGTPGELILRAPWGQLYWRRPDAQMKSVKNGWNRTGLIFEVDADGYFWFKGRDDDMIVSSGYKIPGGEVEQALLSNEVVHEAAVIPSPDPIRGNIVKAFIVLKRGCTPSDDLKEKLKNHVKGKIAPYKYPREIEFIDGNALPRTTTGKIQRFLLRDREIQMKLSRKSI
ncbi:MAG: AMP-dependent synthetase [Desulfarculus sp.]|nr:MAG: AMP-dependent synthetase [Desulfarculus sp.]